MPAQAHQSSARLLEAVDAGDLRAPALTAVLALTLNDAAPAGNNSYNADYTGIAGLAFRVLDFWCVKITSGAAGTDTVQLQTAAGALNVTDALVSPGAWNDEQIIRALTINDATHNFAAGAGFRVAVTDGAADALDKSVIGYVEIALV